MTRPDPESWSKMLAYLRTHHAAMWRQWFEDIEPLNIDSATLRLLVREPIHLKYLTRNCVSQFNEAATAVAGHFVYVRFVNENEAVLEDELAGGKKRSGKTPSAAELADDDSSEEMMILPDNSFKNFIVGDHNELAHAAALAAAANPGSAYNPLFVHGGVGLGKTHLLHAICQEVLRVHKDINLYYTSCNGFMTQFYRAVSQGKMLEFHELFRKVDILVVDDVHDLATRDRTQEEFFHTFNALFQAGKQVVLSSDTPPTEIPNIEERLTSRFNSGLVAQVEKPGYECRTVIIKQLASLRNIELPEDVVAYIAAKIDTNVRDLGSAIINTNHHAYTEKVPITLEHAKKAIGDTSSQAGPHHPTIQDIIDAVTGYFDLNLNDLLSKKRHKSIALPRQIGMWLARENTRYSLQEIGSYFGGRDHTTVMHAIKTVDNRREKDTNIDHDVTRLQDQINHH